MPSRVSSRPASNIVDLPVDQADVSADPARVTEQQMLSELLESVGACGDRRHADGVAAELDQVEASERRRVLVLPAARDAEVLSLDRVRQLRDLVTGELAFARGMPVRRRPR